jgi:DNA-binding NarL/FixJ family response regulator
MSSRPCNASLSQALHLAGAASKAKVPPSIRGDYPSLRLQMGTIAMPTDDHAPAAGPVPAPRPLTQGQRAVLDGLASGRTMSETCQDLGISTTSGRFHLRGAMDALGARTQGQAIARHVKRRDD